MRKAANVLPMPKPVLSYEIALKGTVPSKKNSKMLTRGRLITKPEYQRDIAALAFQVPRVETPLTAAKVEMSFAVSTRRGDLDNKVCTVMDILKDRQVIVDDSLAHVEVIGANWHSAKKGDEGVRITVTGHAA